MTFYIPSELYEVRLYNQAGELQSLLRELTWLNFSQRINAAWNHQITLEMGSDSPTADLLRTIQKDWFIIIYRVCPFTGVKDKVYEGFNQTVVDQARIGGDLIFNLYGTGYTQLLSRRVIIPITGLEHDTRTGVGSDVMKGYVDACCIAPIDTKRIVPGLVNGYGSYGSITTQQIRYINLLSVLENISEDTSIDFGIVGSDPPGSFTFTTKAIWGLDRRINNTDGNVPMLFDQDHNNMEIPILSRNYSEEKNYIYIGGSGVGTEREVVEVDDPTLIAESPWGRKEAFDDARQEDETDGVRASGQAYLKDNAPKITLNFNVRQTANSRWLRDWGLGDLINARYFTYLFDKQITEVDVTVTPAQESGMIEVINVEMEDV